MREVKGTRTKKKRRGKRIHKPLIAVLVLFLLVVMGVQMMRLYQKREYYKQQEAAAQEALEEQEQKSEDLEEYEAYTKSDEYVEDQAQSKLGLIYDNEIVFREED